MIKVQNLVKQYADGEGKIFALNDVSLEVENKEFVVILGPSGSGKSTLINVMSALDRCDLGSVIYDGEDITKYSDRKLTQFRRNNIGFIFQSYYLLPDLTVENNIRLGANLVHNTDYNTILETLNIKDYLKRMPYQLSGGQQQRVAIARALAKKPKILFCDEPTGALDEETGKLVLSLLQKYQEDNDVSIVMVTHNQGIADMATKVVKMNSGKIIEQYKNDTIVPAFRVRWA
ncbi:MAG TPA: ABC transporter ATP-binding protein [Lachnospiraceae bacterium]|nr:ABC transporter ATP-binding protein [Lachnospiraceae bacterium]